MHQAHLALRKSEVPLALKLLVSAPGGNICGFAPIAFLACLARHERRWRRVSALRKKIIEPFAKCIRIMPFDFSVRDGRHMDTKTLFKPGTVFWRV